MGHVSLSFVYYLPEELQDVSLGYFLHDVGKIHIPGGLLNKNGPLSDGEFEVVKKHSYEKGINIIQKNRLSTPFIVNTVKYHHSNVFNNEEGCYPDDKHPIELPAYVKICKLADIYDAMTSKRCYKEAFNPVGVVTEICKQGPYVTVYPQGLCKNRRYFPSGQCCHP
jgi:HD-GYP domain-containing protein (c-di-GMP phosphodiesterase class II)